MVLVLMLALSVVVVVLSVACVMMANSLHRAYSRFYEHSQFHSEKWAAASADASEALMSASRNYLEMQRIEAELAPTVPETSNKEAPRHQEPRMAYEPQGVFDNAG